jgi:hypothetical protein
MACMYRYGMYTASSACMALWGFWLFVLATRTHVSCMYASLKVVLACALGVLALASCHNIIIYQTVTRNGTFKNVRLLGWTKIYWLGSKATIRGSCQKVRNFVKKSGFGLA